MRPNSPLIRRLEKEVVSRVRARGWSYFENGAVCEVSSTPSSVAALVSGTSEYLVLLIRRSEEIRVSCSCPYFEDRLDTCKHIWATLLEADSQGLLDEWGKGQRLSLAPNPIDFDEVDYDDPDFDFDEEEEDLAEYEYDPLDGPPRYHGVAEAAPLYPPSSSPPRRRHVVRADIEPWQQQLTSFRDALIHTPRQAKWPADEQILYVVDAEQTTSEGTLALELATRKPKQDGQWGKPRTLRISRQQIEELPEKDDREILIRLLGAESGEYNWYDAEPSSRLRLPPPISDTLLPLLCRSERCFVRDPAGELVGPLQWDDGEPWVFRAQVFSGNAGSDYQMRGILVRRQEIVDLSEPLLVVAGGLVFVDNHVARLEDHGVFPWMALLRKEGRISFTEKHKDNWLELMLSFPSLPPLDLPEELRFQQVSLTPRPHLRICSEKQHYATSTLTATLSFDYDGLLIPEHRPETGIFDPRNRRRLLRDPEAEEAAAGRLLELRLRRSMSYYSREWEWRMTAAKMPATVRTLVEEGWVVEADGKVVRRPGAFALRISSGIDWFDLEANVDYEGHAAPLPELLAALKRGDNMVRLGDGSLGLLPEEWLRKYGLLAGLGTPEGNDRLRFRSTQAGLLDALLLAQPEATCDELFERVRSRLKTFDGIQPADAPEGFQGRLRAYQQTGLGWIYFLQDFGFGGCLADDMGLGKTIQVLALLESRRRSRSSQDSGAEEKIGPSLVVVPKTLIFNWKQEAARFTPQLRVRDHTGIERSKDVGSLDDYDVLLTTYGTLRRDVTQLKEVFFDYVVLDESQAIKNAQSQTAKAARLLQGRHRLALSGTPIENHLGELWSLFEFLNPGLLGSASVFRLLERETRQPDSEQRRLLAGAVRPYFLRRTKDQVEPDLPPKHEQTLYCDLKKEQRRLYDELRDHYRRTLLGRIDKMGMQKTRIQVLEALLRLRQTACHPGLVDKARVADPAAKLEVLLPLILEVLEENHKALVFSQFTSLLSILRKQLDGKGVPYEYLDGKTRDRETPVRRFQQDPDSKLFLISLKAGGLGLNLTAAEYVFLMDPWWNPAVEAQAVDRTHRIGQTRPVIAYRLIARDTVEERVLELQRSKRELAEAIITADNSLIRNLHPEDLELLLT